MAESPLATPGRELCLMLATDDAFVPGARVMLESFLRTNPWFDGDIVVAQNGLSAAAEAALRQAAPDIILLPVEQALASRVNQLIAAYPDLRNAMASFAALMALAPMGYRQVLFCDVDMMFLGSVEDVLASGADLTAVGDGCYLRGNERGATDFRETSKGEGTIGRTFNSGFMLLGPGALTGADYRAMLDRMSVERFPAFDVGLRDQVLFNAQFAGRQELVSWRNNFLIKHRELIIRAETLRPQDLRVLHFNLKRKPWQPAWRAATFKDPFMVWADAQWRAAEARLPPLPDGALA